MPPRKSRRRRRGAPVVPLLLLALVAIAGIGVTRWLWSPDGAGPAAAPSVPIPTLAATAAPPPANPVAAGTPEPASTPATTVTASPEPTGAVAAPSASPSPLAHAGGPQLAIIIDDCGQWPVTERSFVALPFPLTLSVLPHVAFGATIAREASAAGKGVMLHLPMETVSGRYPGPGTITTAMGDAAIRSEVRADLDGLPEAAGVNNHEGSLATADRRVMGDVVDVLAGDHRFFIDSRTTKKTVAESIARDRGVPTARRNVFLDDVDDQAAVEAALRHAGDVARENGSAIAIGHPRPATLAAVRAVAPELAASGITFTLASSLVH